MYFEDGSRLSQDPCALKARDVENNSLLDYQTFNFYPASGCGEVYTKLNEFAMQNRNLRFKSGFGVTDACVVDNDSQLRITRDIRPVEHQQLSTRVFWAVPSLDKGGLVPGLESMLTQGMGTGALRDCHKLAEVEYDRMPMSDCMSEFVKSAGQVIPDGQRIGKPSKEIFLQERRAKVCARK